MIFIYLFIFVLLQPISLCGSFKFKVYFCHNTSTALFEYYSSDLFIELDIKLSCQETDHHLREMFGNSSQSSFNIKLINDLFIEFCKILLLVPKYLFIQGKTQRAKSTEKKSISHITILITSTSIFSFLKWNIPRRRYL